MSHFQTRQAEFWVVERVLDSTMKSLFLTFCLVGSSLAQSAWTPQGRTLERVSYDRTSIGIHFVILSGEDPLESAQGCARYYQALFTKVSGVNCYAFRSSTAYSTLFGKLRNCYVAYASLSRLYSELNRSGLEKNPPKRCPR